MATGDEMRQPPKTDHAKFRRELEEAADRIEGKPFQCKCGNPVPCNKDFKFLVLYDIVGDGVAKLNMERFQRCTKKPKFQEIKI